MKKELTMASLFAGIGGFELAATWAGIKPVWSNEIDPWCCKVLRKNFDHEIIEKDIRQISANSTNSGIESLREWENETNDKKGNIELRPVDILTGGFPCQPFSHAGKRKGKDDNRYLWPEYLRIIRELRPSWIIAENVAGLISMENGRTLEGILIDLENENYQTEIYNIPACSVGAWHKRERIWIICHSTKSRLQDRRSTQVEQSGKVEEFKRSGSEYDTNTIKFNDDKSGYGSGSICGIGQTETEIQGCEDASDTISQRGCGRTAREQDASNVRESSGSKELGPWDAEPGMGGRFDGLPNWLHRHNIKGYGQTESIRRTKILQDLWNKDVEKAIWGTIGGLNRIQQAAILFFVVCEYEKSGRVLWEQCKSKETFKGLLQGLWGQIPFSSPPPRWEQVEQFKGEYNYSMREMPFEIASWESGIDRVSTGIKGRVDRLKGLGNAIVPQVAYEFFKAIVEYENQSKL